MKIMCTAQSEKLTVQSEKLAVDRVMLRPPVPSDGYTLNQLVAASPPLDGNSVYCNLLQASHFAETSVAATLNDKLVGYISAYIPPNEPGTLFVWQVVVAEEARGQGLAKQMLRWLVDLPACESVVGLSTTITADNAASWALFEGFAREFGIIPAKSVLFQRDKHFGGQHDDEYLLRIAPLPNRHHVIPMASSFDGLVGGSKRWLD
jgi:L-2,4-diaminobutyric acid acetyltransferase